MAHLIKLMQRADERGLLTVAERELPFKPERLFWITDADGALRGGHRHKATQMVLVALRGEVEVNVQTALVDQAFLLDAPGKALFLAPEDWHTFRCRNGAALLVIASHKYDPDDYITEPYARP